MRVRTVCGSGRFNVINSKAACKNQVPHLKPSATADGSDLSLNPYTLRFLTFGS
jgi:hypothetical protein